MKRTGTSDYLRGALRVMPLGAVMLALVVGAILSSIDIGPDTSIEPLLFQGTTDDARTLLIGISGTMMTVIVLVLGLTLLEIRRYGSNEPRVLTTLLRELDTIGDFCLDDGRRHAIADQARTVAARLGT